MKMATCMYHKIIHIQCGSRQISRNLLNIGTISSGDITATRLVSDAGNNYSQIKLSGDNGANGNSYRFSLNNNNTLLLQRSTDNFAANSTLALTIDSSQNATFTGDVSLPDSKKIKLGAGDDLQLFHNGSSSVIRNETGHLDIKNGANMLTLDSCVMMVVVVKLLTLD